MAATMGGTFNQAACSSSSPSVSLVSSSGTTRRSNNFEGTIQQCRLSSLLCFTPINRCSLRPAFSSTLSNTSSKLQTSLQVVACVPSSQPEKTTTTFTNSTKLYVSGLSFRTSEESLRNAFQPFGQLIDVNLVMDKIANRPRGFAFLRYATKEESEKAIEGMHGKFLDGRVIFVEYAKPKSQLNQEQKPQLFELSNGTMKVIVSNYGCTITSLFVPDKDGKLDDIVLGFDTLEPYLNGEAPYFGCIVGRVANRIKEGKFTLNGTEYCLPINNGPNSLHGGLKGFDKVIWEVIEHKQDNNPSITFKYHARDGEEGYPGDLTVTATYTLTSKTTLTLNMEAIPENKPTPVSLAQHTYFNLSGHNSGTILNHTAQIFSNHITPVDQTQIPTGEIKPVAQTPFDFTTEKKIGTSIHEIGLGYDHNYVLDCGEEKLGLKRAVKLKDPVSSRVLNLWTDAPGMQFYTANYVNGIVGKKGAVYEKHSGVCLETQGFPNAVNQGNFPSIVVEKGGKYRHSMVYEFSVE